MSETETCTCPLIDVSTWTETRYVRGDPRGSGCPLHETPEMHLQRWAAEEQARYGGGGPR